MALYIKENKGSERTDTVRAGELRQHIKWSTWFLKASLDGSRETELHTIYFHLMYHGIYGSGRFGRPEVLDASTFERFDVHIMQNFRTYSRCQS